MWVDDWLLALLCFAEGATSELVAVEMVHEVSGALDPSIGQLTNLLAVEAVPPPPAELLVEVNDELCVDKVDKGVSDVARVVLVDGQVEEINLHFVVASDLLVKHLLGVLVGDVADH